MAMENAVVVWRGRTRTVEFSYQDFNGDKTRRQVDITAVLYDPIDDKTYLEGFCHLRNDTRHFKTFNITTMLKVGSKRYEIWEWFDECLGIAPPWHRKAHYSNIANTGVMPERLSEDSGKVEKVVQNPPSMMQRLDEYNKKQAQKVEELKAKHAQIKATKEYSPAEKIALKLVKPLWITVVALLALVALADMVSA